MPPRGLTGSRIRDRRLLAGVKQSALARTVGISAAYLNLIEHNRRRIGGKLLGDIAEALHVEPAILADGAEAELVTRINEAAASQPGTAAETDRAEEFAGRFPGWAGLLRRQARRIGDLERTVASLSDRMAHDPHLAASLHDLLSTVTAINATASILVDTDEIEAEWRDRFHRNIHEDSQRLADSSRALVAYLDSSPEADSGTGSPQEELEAWLKARDFHVPELERALPASEASILGSDAFVSASSRDLAQRFLARYRADAKAMPLADFSEDAARVQYDPGVLAADYGVDLAAVLRRIAMLPTQAGAGHIGLVVCDGSGTLTFRKQVDGFPLPRFGAACPLWPLYQALSRPLQPIRALVELAERDVMRFLVYAIALPAGVPGFDAPPVYEATMLMLPVDRVAVPDLPVQRIGTSCRICPQAECRTRREPSILAGGV
ncbi:MAG: short-chain fatty acyl-CoA regulator family protein [Rhodobacter sp.]|nr:short-chain fatty acyl-CoA regulator family protein [Rhodobacter sp.]